jgi:uncharacterized membrane protein YdjX (TVP38/TMEM64 family)
VLKIAFAGALTASGFLLLFAVAHWLHLTVLIDTAWIEDQDPMIAAASCVLLLVGDAVLPAPSSLLLIALGALLGKTSGAVAGFCGTMGAAVLAFWIGRRGTVLLSGRDTKADSSTREDYVNRFNVLVVMVTRPIPVLAETTALLAGASGMPRGKFILGATLGNLPVVYVYALLGSSAAANRVLIFALVAMLGAAAAFNVFAAKRQTAAKVNAESAVDSEIWRIG